MIDQSVTEQAIRECAAQHGFDFDQMVADAQVHFTENVLPTENVNLTDLQIQQLIEDFNRDFYHASS